MFFLTSTFYSFWKTHVLHVTFFIVVTILRTQRWIQFLKLVTDPVKTRVNRRHAAGVVIHVAGRVAQVTLSPNASLSKWESSILIRTQNNHFNTHPVTLWQASVHVYSVSCSAHQRGHVTDVSLTSITSCSLSSKPRKQISASSRSLWGSL